VSINSAIRGLERVLVENGSRLDQYCLSRALVIRQINLTRRARKRASRELVTKAESQKRVNSKDQSYWQSLLQGLL
jgi:hypothetical protein